MEEIARIHIRLIQKETNSPLTGSQYQVKFYDKDFFKSNYLGESDLDAFGHAILPLTRKGSSTRPFQVDKNPDIYFIVLENGKEIYKSPVSKNLHVKEHIDFPASGGLHCDLGTFSI